MTLSANAAATVAALLLTSSLVEWEPLFQLPLPPHHDAVSFNASQGVGAVAWCCCHQWQCCLLLFMMPFSVIVAIATVFPIPVLTVIVDRHHRYCCCRPLPLTVAVAISITAGWLLHYYSYLCSLLFHFCCCYQVPSPSPLPSPSLLLLLSLLLPLSLSSLWCFCCAACRRPQQFPNLCFFLLSHALGPYQVAVQRWTGFRTHFVYTSTSRILYPTKVDMIPITTFLVLMGTTGYVEKICHSSNL